MEKIKTGDMLHIGINSDGKYAVRLADSDNLANAYAAEDITGIHHVLRRRDNRPADLLSDC